ncbi:iron-sulfur cluster assembly scaffold protein [Candidatus Falkowbacteria bacterium]|nr:iron-sulfur cluster assembly scaffold protein [Candidatus Falkowbacteria bacterium]
MAYRIHVGQRDSLIKLAGIFGKKYFSNSYKSISSWFDDDYFYTPITDIKRIDYRGKVYNLEVENAHSFISEAFCLHNCGDIMKIYIKVGKNKKGEETIKDIKFETLGCGAAIATSSMLTEMVKGKTIAEALKIKKLDIADELGGLPSQKLHCSILAHEGLEAAVKDYESKKFNK